MAIVIDELHDRQEGKRLREAVPPVSVAITGLHPSDLGQVCEEVLQCETVMERDGSGALEDQADLPLMGSSNCTICKSAVVLCCRRHSCPKALVFALRSEDTREGIQEVL
ncbi:hypothetical protein EYF80_012701 [Liparis tanakae]|uniref:Uncharacterized protein n=1 Tax=Liparis tanakae TaxID=230148 RepID=A0A4Z2IIR0_9TELE|nr:hypothetical protein EYF80_012701 [Liparis tanakae]